MRKFNLSNSIIITLCLIICFITMNVSGGTPGIIQGKTSALSPQDADEALRTGPIGYDIKKLIGSVDTTKVVIGTKWTAPSGFSYVCRGIYNSSATATNLSVRTTNSTDTIPIKLGAYGTSPWTFPFIHTIFALAKGDSVGVGTDTVIVILQLTK